MDRLQLQFSTTPAWQSGAIRLVTRSRFSHVDIVIPPDGFLGASDPGGVMIREAGYHEFLRRNRMTLKTDKADAIIARAKTQIGKPFDGTALYQTMDPNRDWHDRGEWYCAELVAWALEEEGYWDFGPYPPLIDRAHVSPEDLIKYLVTRFDPAEFTQEVTE